MLELAEELVEGKGWIQVAADDPERLQGVSQAIVEYARKFKELESIRSMNDLRSRLGDLTESEINQLKLHLITIPNLAIEFQKCFLKSTLKVAGSRLFLQRRSHILFNIPGMKNTQVMHHIEAMSGISPFSFVLWAAFHDTLDGSGVYIVDQDESMRLMDEEAKNGKVMGDKMLSHEFSPVELEYGQAIIFNPIASMGALCQKVR